MAKICANCGASMPDNAKFCFECGEKLALICPQCGNTELTQTMKFCPECGYKFQKVNKPSVSPLTAKPDNHEAKSEQRSASAIDTGMLEPIVKCYTGQPAPIDCLLFEAKKNIFLLTENTELDKLRFTLSEMEIVKKQFEISLKNMYGIHVSIYNGILDDMLGKELAQKFIIGEDALQKNFHLFLGRCERNILTVYNLCESLKRNIATLDNTITEKMDRSEANSARNWVMAGAAGVAALLSGGLALPLMAGAGMIGTNISNELSMDQLQHRIDESNNNIKETQKKLQQELATLYDIVRKEQLDLVCGPMLTNLTGLFNKLLENGVLQKETLLSKLHSCFEKYKYMGIRLQGKMYLLGVTVPQNLNKAEEVLINAAKHNDGDACNLLGKLAQKNSEGYKAFTFYTKATDLGSVDGMINLAACYQEGFGVEEDPKKAFALYSYAANSGNSDGMNNVGECYKNGIGVEKDAQKAFIWYKQAADAGSFNGMNNVGECYRNGIGVAKDVKKAFAYTKLAADAGNVSGINDLGYCYNYGLGVAKDTKKAFALYKLAADAGNSYGMTNLGDCYRNGIGVAKDDQKAFALYKLAADAGNSYGVANLGDCYRHGIGVEKDSQKAFAYTKKAADAGNVSGINNLGYHYNNGIGVEKDGKKAFAYYKQAADAGNAVAMKNVGFCYEYCVGVKKDLNKAAQWYKMAIDNGCESANKDLERLHEDY